MNVVVLAAKERMRLDMQFDIGVARRPTAEAWHSLSFKPQHLPVLGTLWHRDRSCDAIGNIQEPDRKHIAHILAARPERTLRPTSSARKRARQKLFQFLVVGKSVLCCVRGIGRTVSEVTVEPLLRPLRSAGIDLTRIEPSTLLLVLEQVVSSRYVLKLRLRPLVARMQIGMKFACQFLECVLDFRVGRIPIYAEGLVRVLHASDPIQATNRGSSLAANREIHSQPH